MLGATRPLNNEKENKMQKHISYLIVENILEMK